MTTIIFCSEYKNAGRLQWGWVDVGDYNIIIRLQNLGERPEYNILARLQIFGYRVLLQIKNRLAWLQSLEVKWFTVLNTNSTEMGIKGFYDGLVREIRML